MVPVALALHGDHRALVLTVLASPVACRWLDLVALALQKAFLDDLIAPCLYLGLPPVVQLAWAQSGTCPLLPCCSQLFE